MRLSGLDEALSLDLPIIPMLGTRLPPLTSSLYTPQPDRTPFQARFGMVPASDLSTAGTGLSTAESINAHTVDRLAVLRDEGLILFRRATQPGLDQSSERRNALSASIGKLAIVLDMSTDVLGKEPVEESLTTAPKETAQLAVPAFLLAHASLEQDRGLRAMEYLAAAIRLSPESLNGSGETIARYYGDVDENGRSARLERQMREFSAIWEKYRENPEANLVSAYCQVRLADWQRVEEFLDRAATALADANRPPSDIYRVLSAAMRAAARSQRNE